MTFNFKKSIFIAGICLIILLISNCQSVRISEDASENDMLKKAYNKVTLKDYHSAILIYTKILDMNAENTEAYAYRGMCKYHLKDYAGSIIDYTEAIERQPDYAEAYNLRGISKGELGDKDGACEDWKKSFEYGFKNSFMLIKEFCWEED